MFEITLLAMGKLKEKFYTSASEEYAKRLGAYCKFKLLELPEVRLPENPSPAEIAAGLDKEAETIFQKIPKGAYLCIFTPEGKELSSEGFAEKLAAVKLTVDHIHIRTHCLATGTAVTDQRDFISALTFVDKL